MFVCITIIFKYRNDDRRTDIKLCTTIMFKYRNDNRQTDVILCTKILQFEVDHDTFPLYMSFLLVACHSPFRSRCLVEH